MKWAVTSIYTDKKYLPKWFRTGKTFNNKSSLQANRKKEEHLSNCSAIVLQENTDVFKNVRVCLRVCVWESKREGGEREGVCVCVRETEGGERKSVCECVSYLNLAFFLSITFAQLSLP